MDRDRHQQEPQRRHHHLTQQKLSPEEKAEKIIREAEMSRARIHETPGKLKQLLGADVNILPHLDPNNDFMHLAMVDETYQQVASHVDLGTQAKIIEGKYVDLTKLVPKDRVMTNDDTRFEMRIKDGHSYWVPANNEGMAISNYSRWEQAFHVFSDIYMRAHPTRSVELVQYNHIIHLASQSYTWDNVYMYDKDFRLHLAKHPHRS